MEVALQAGLHVPDLTALKLDSRVAPHVPELRNLGECLWRGGLDHVLGEIEPACIQGDLRVHKELRHHRGLGQLTQVEDHALSLGDQVEVAREGLREPGKGMVLAGDRLVLQALAGDHLLTGFDAHLHVRYQRLVLGQADLRLLHHIPLTSCPALVLVLHLGPVKHAQHANHRHVVLSERKLLEEVIGLEHDITHAGSCKPARLVNLLLRRFFQILRVHWVQGE
mmetsp:Transcript_38521/g.78883  ORF Transcript_38521/g.78883 Transcript_38521/m.78883 type:complete len:224 (-) Transcript_38521:197-868(-)